MAVGVSQVQEFYFDWLAPSPLQGAFRAAVQARRLRRVRGALDSLSPVYGASRGVGFSLRTSGKGQTI
jgi:hypothetical protein